MIRVLVLAILHFQTVQAWSPAQARIGEQLTRSNFIYSTASAFFFSEMVVNGHPDECEAKENPRYIEREVQMKYGDDKNGNPRTRGVLVKKFTGDNSEYLRLCVSASSSTLTRINETIQLDSFFPRLRQSGWSKSGQMKFLSLRRTSFEPTKETMRISTPSRVSFTTLTNPLWPV